MMRRTRLTRPVRPGDADVTELHRFKAVVRMLYFELNCVAPRSFALKLTPWPALHQYFERCNEDASISGRLDTIAAVAIEKMVGTFGLGRCDFVTTFDGCSPLLFAVRHCGPKTVAALCRYGEVMHIDAPS